MRSGLPQAVPAIRGRIPRRKAAYEIRNLAVPHASSAPQSRGGTTYLAGLRGWGFKARSTAPDAKEKPVAAFAGLPPAWV